MKLNRTPYKVGITGGIGSGKSEMTSFLRSKGYCVVDADQIAREVVEPGKPGLMRIIASFGTEILTDFGTLNRSKLGQLIFDDPDARALLNSLLHPLIKEETKNQIEALKDEKIVFADVPLLFETQSESFYDETVLVYASESICLERIMNRDAIGYDHALKKIKAQMSMDEKLKRATYVINNSDSLDAFHNQIEVYLTALRTR